MDPTLELPTEGEVFAVWKPKGPSSFQIVQKVRNITGQKKVGHAGTLDPLAEGVLVLGLGRAGTKQLGSIVEKEKEYEATIRLGEESSTNDAEGSKTAVAFKETPSRKTIEVVARKFIGHVKQVPPPYSAVKVNGKRAYTLARKNKKVALEARPIFIKDIEILNYSWPTLKIKVTTGQGVYIRSLARDLGRELKTGGYLSGLIRTRVGQFTKETCLPID